GNIVKNSSHDTADKAMLAAINQMGKVMNIETIAKHVENISILNRLKETGIDYAQGYYLDKPEYIDKQVEEIIKSMRLRSVKH
ncbi:MAG: hypothetical protein DRQ44_13065, partial [Gammaproteobacteria bacterium]